MSKGRLTIGAGAVVSVVDLDPFGGETSRSQNAQLMSQRFTSYERDGNGGDEAQARRFEGQWSRFSQPDLSARSYRLRDPQSFNRYTYASNDPVNRIDPTGLFEINRGYFDAMRALLEFFLDSLDFERIVPSGPGP